MNMTTESDAAKSHAPGSLSTSPNPGGKRMWAWLLVVVIVLGVGFFFLQRRAKAQSNNKSKNNKGQNDAVPIVTDMVKKGDIGVYINALGTVTPVYTDTVTARVTGQIMQVYYQEGQMVHKGDPLLQIDPRPYEVQLSQAEGQYQHDLGL